MKILGNFIKIFEKEKPTQKCMGFGESRHSTIFAPCEKMPTNFPSTNIFAEE